MDDAVRDIVNGEMGDLALSMIVSICLEAKNSSRNLFDNPLNEPTWLRKYIFPSIEDGLAELAVSTNALDIAMKSLRS